MVKKLFKRLSEKIKSITGGKTKQNNKSVKKTVNASAAIDSRTKDRTSENRARQPYKKHEVNRDNRKPKEENQFRPVRHSRDEKENQAKPKNLQRRPRQQKPAPRVQQNADEIRPEKIKQSVKEKDDWQISQFNVPEQEGKMRFHDLNLHREIMHAIADLNFQYCTPIQKEILETSLKGIDATGRAQTGTGKTAAFLITILERLLSKADTAKKNPRAPLALILAPTRELVIQIGNDAKALSKYTQIKTVEIFGGMDFNKQRNKLRSMNAEIIVATPGRLLDFMHKKDIFLSEVEILVIDEADRMLDMGFIPDVRKIIHSTPPKIKRQTLFFSATLNSFVQRLAASWTKDAVNVEIEPERKAGEAIEQFVYIVTNEEKFPLLYNLIVKQNLSRVIIFTNRKDETKHVKDMLDKFGINNEILSGDVEQRKRLKTLNDFKSGNIRVLVATDVAGRGIHIEAVSHVINYTLPEDPEDYVHRIGRTGRAGASGISISFASEDDSFNIPAIEKFLGHKLNCVYPPEELIQPVKINQE